MKKVILCLLSLLALVSTCAALDDKKKDAGASHPDFTGTWRLDKSKSDFGPFTDSPVIKADVSLTIRQVEPELKVSRRMSRDGHEETQELVFYTDERGESNPATLGRVGVKSKTKWERDKLVSRASLARQSPGGGTFQIDSTERWQLSSDGKTLTQTDTISTPRGEQTVKWVFTRQ